MSIADNSHAPAGPKGLSLRRVSKLFGAHKAVDAIDLEIAAGEFVAIVGPSGSGKSTALRLIAGLEQPDSGEIRIGARPVNDLPVRDRDVAMVFQNYALYPHLTVFKNLAAPLEIRGLAREAIDHRVEAAAEMLDIAYLLNRKPPQLSGGQRQRVALARALVREPSLFLLDEPLSSLDAAQRSGLRAEIARLHRQLGATFLYVTHDQAEAMMMADRIVVMNAGRIEQIDAPQALYDNPANVFVAGFIGGMNLLPAGALPWLASEGMVTGIRPEHLSEEATPGAMALEAIVQLTEPMGAATRLTVRTDEHAVVARLASRRPFDSGQAITLWFDPRDIHLFDAASGRALQHNRRPLQ